MLDSFTPAESVNVRLPAASAKMNLSLLTLQLSWPRNHASVHACRLSCHACPAVLLKYLMPSWPLALCMCAACVPRTQLNRHLSQFCQLSDHSPTHMCQCFKELTRVSAFDFAQAQPLLASLRQLTLPGHVSVTSMGLVITGRSAVDMDPPHSDGMHGDYDSSHYQWLQLDSFHQAEQSFPSSNSSLNGSAGA